MSTTAFMLPRFFAQTPSFSVSFLSFSLSRQHSTVPINIIILSSKRAASRSCNTNQRSPLAPSLR